MTAGRIQLVWRRNLPEVTDRNDTALFFSAVNKITEKKSAETDASQVHPCPVGDIYTTFGKIKIRNVPNDPEQGNE
jgi:hypothetical protein